MISIDYKTLCDIFYNEGPYEYIDAFTEKYPRYFLARCLEEAKPSYYVHSSRDRFIVSHEKKWSRVIRDLVFKVQKRENNPLLSDLRVLIRATKFENQMLLTRDIIV